MPSLEMWWSVRLLLAGRDAALRSLGARRILHQSFTTTYSSETVSQDALAGRRPDGLSKAVTRCSGTTMRLSLLGPILPPSSSPAATDPLSLDSYEALEAKLAIPVLPFLLPMQ